ncbi:MAG: hypothetical protein HY687_06630 [Chloroflexi bacterium]|nr:hypothetical protein [Chloroflexota bacterium]
MCQVCGCQEYIALGQNATLKRAAEIIQKLGVTPANAPLFEDGEYICGLIGPRVSSGPAAGEVREIVSWLNAAHEDLNAKRNQAAVAAAREVFRRFPNQSNLHPKEIVALWHQLEQLEKELRSEPLLADLKPEVKAALEAVRHVHDKARERMRELREQYGLPR